MSRGRGVRGASLATAFVGFVEMLAACQTSQPPGAIGVTNAQMSDARSAASRLAETTCQHAASCNQIGETKSYASKEACTVENRGRFENGLRASECPRGVATTRLEACASEVTAESCSGMTGGFNRMTSCKTDALCP